MAQQSLITEQGFVSGVGLGTAPISESDLIGPSKDKDKDSDKDKDK